MPRQPTIHERSGSLDKIWIALQRLPVKPVRTIVGVRGQSALGLVKLILTSQEKDRKLPGHASALRTGHAIRPGERFAFNASAICSATSLSTAKTSLKSRS